MRIFWWNIKWEMRNKKKLKKPCPAHTFNWLIHVLYVCIYYIYDVTSWEQRMQMQQAVASSNFATFFFKMLFFHLYYWSTRIPYDSNTLIKVGKKGSIGSGLSAADLERIIARSIFWTAIQTDWTKHCHKRWNCPKKWGKRARIWAQQSQLERRPIPLPSLLSAKVCLQENNKFQ